MRSRPSSRPAHAHARRFHAATRAAPLLTLVLLGALPAASPPEPSTGTVTEDLLAVTRTDPTEITWRLLSQLNYMTGEMTPELKALDGQVVKIPGFGVPLEDWAATATEFLLVPYFGACVHTPPPPANQLVYVRMTEDNVATLDGWLPIWIEGTLTIESTMSYYGEVGFRVDAERVYPY